MTNADRQEILKKKDVERVAELSRLKLDEQELSKTAAQLERVLEYFTRLSGVDTSEVDSESTQYENSGRLREDVALPGIGRDELTGLTENKKDGFLTVPRAVE